MRDFILKRFCWSQATRYKGHRVQHALRPTGLSELERETIMAWTESVGRQTVERHVMNWCVLETEACSQRNISRKRSS